jgi:hypothetical protein
MCTDCQTFFEAKKCEKCDTNSTINESKECDCDKGFARASKDLKCEACFEDCAACTAIGSYVSCSECKSPKFDAPFGSGSDKFCAPVCPAKYTKGTAPVCTAPNTENLFTVNCETLSTKVYDDSTYVWTATSFPAYQRGQYLKKSDNHNIAAADFYLNHTFTFVIWVRADDLAAEMCILCLTNGADSLKPKLRLYSKITSGNLMVDVLNKAGDALSTAYESSGKALVAQTWAHVGLTIKLDGATAAKSTIKIWKDSAADAEHTFGADEFFVHSTVQTAGNITALVGLCKKFADGSNESPFLGFVKEFYIDKSYTAGNFPHLKAAVCHANCSGLSCTETDTNCVANWGFTKVNVSDNCGSGCNQGCRHELDCVACVDDPTDKLCALCFDAECKKCTSYGEGSCATAAGSCAATTNSEEDGTTGKCKCKDTFGRDSAAHRCADCHRLCNKCTTISTQKDCTECDADKKDNAAPGATKKYCVSACPTGFTDTDNRCSIADDKKIAVHYDFGKVPVGNNDTDMYANEGKATGLTITFKVAAGKPSARPSGKRGIYFDKATTEEVWVQPVFLLSHTSSLHFWLFRKSDGADMTVFNRVRDTWGNSGLDSRFLRLHITAGNKMGLYLAKDSHSNGSPAYDPGEDTDPADGGVIETSKWYYLVWSFELIDVSDTKVTFYINGTARANPKTFEKTFIMDEESYVNYLGIERSETAVWENRWDGYIHDVALHQGKYDAAKFSLAEAGCKTGCWTNAYNFYQNHLGVSTGCNSNCNDE